MKRLDPLAPDHLILPGRASHDDVAKNRRASGRLQLEPVLGPQPLWPDHAERTHGAWAVELFPEHQPGVVQTGSLPPGSGSDLRRPDAVELRDEGRDPLRRRRDYPLVAVRDLHPSLPRRSVTVTSIDTRGLPLPQPRTAPAGLPSQMHLPVISDSRFSPGPASSRAVAAARLK